MEYVYIPKPRDVLRAMLEHGAYLVVQTRLDWIRVRRWRRLNGARSTHRRTPHFAVLALAVPPPAGSPVWARTKYESLGIRTQVSAALAMAARGWIEVKETQPLQYEDRDVIYALTDAGRAEVDGLQEARSGVIIGA